VVVARRLLALSAEHLDERKPAAPIIIRGSEGMAVQYAQCCHPIPGDPIIGLINKGQGMLIHTHDCPLIAKTRADPDKVFDVEWAPETKKLFNVGIRIVVLDKRGVLAKVAAEIAAADSNIDNVAVTPDSGDQYATMNFTLQVFNRLHLAKVLRALRGIPEVIRITRIKS
jgi:GTP pyrophosphokinase